MCRVSLRIKDNYFFDGIKIVFVLQVNTNTLHVQVPVFLTTVLVVVPVLYIVYRRGLLITLDSTNYVHKYVNSVM